LHAVLAKLHERGHNVQVLVKGREGGRIIDGVRVASRPAPREMLEYGRRADVVVGQLADRWSSLALAARCRRPVVYFVQVGNVPRGALFGDPDLTVFSSVAVRNRHPWIRKALVVHPLVVEDDYRTTPGDAIAMINLTEQKGASVFFALAERLPEREFLGIKTWGPQAIPERLPANCNILGPVDDMREAYHRTRVLLVPSEYESYGRVGVEAAVCGIPTIAHPSDGVREALGDAAIWANRSDFDAWLAAIQSLDDPVEYARHAQLARMRYEQLQHVDEIDLLETELLRLVHSRAEC
jgi:glycosyltransferase involved in cell wall biosynthesis